MNKLKYHFNSIELQFIYYPFVANLSLCYIQMASKELLYIHITMEPENEIKCPDCKEFLK